MSPSPTKNPLSEICNTSLSTPDPKNPLKLKISTKRKIRHSESEVPDKKSKMGEAVTKDDLNAFMKRFETVTKEQEAKLDERFDNVNQKIDSIDVKQNIVEISKDLSSLKDSVTQVQVDKVVTNNRLDAMEKDMKELRDEMSSNKKEAVLPGWKATLARDVWEHEHGLMIFGIKIEDKEVGVRNFLKEKLKIPDPEKFKIREVITLGKTNDQGKPPPTLVRFSHPSERNSILPYSKHLEKGINIEKNIPKAYQKTHKEFKRTSWKLKSLGYQTQVIFESHNMVLRYRTKEAGYLFSNHDSWFPEPDEMSDSQQARPRQPANGKQYTLPISKDVDAAINRTVIVSGIEVKLIPAEMKAKFTNFIDATDHADIEAMKANENGVITIVGKSWVKAETFAKKYHGKDFLGSKISCTLFYEYPVRH